MISQTAYELELNTLLSGMKIALTKRKKICPRINANRREYFSFYYIVAGNPANWFLFAFIRVYSRAENLKIIFLYCQQQLCRSVMS